MPTFEPVPTSHVGRRSRLATILPLLAPVIGLIVVVAVAWPEGAPQTDPVLPSPDRDRSAVAPSEPPTPRSITTQGESTAFPARAFGMPVRTVGEAMAERRNGRLESGLVAVAGYLVPNLRSSACDPDAGESEQAFCRRTIVLASAPSPPPASTRDGDLSARSMLGRPHLHPQVPPGTLLPRIDQLTLTGADDAVTPVRVVLIGGFDDPRAIPCTPGGRHCGEEFVVERLAWADGRWRERKVVRDPGLPGEEATGTRVALRVIAARERDRGEVILGQAIVTLERLATIDPVAASAVTAPVDGPVWYQRSMKVRSDDMVNPLVAWVVVHDRTGLILAVGPEHGPPG